MKQVVHNKPKIKSSTRTITTSDACKSISPSSRSRRVVNISMVGAYGITALVTSTCIGLLGSTLYSTNNVSAVGSSVHFEIVADAHIGMSLDNSVILNIVPSSTGQFTTATLPITIDTNNSDGYTLTMSAQNTLLYRNTALSNGTVPTIASIDNNNSNGYTEEDFKSTSNTNTLNKWGYKIGTNNYFPVTTTSIKIAESTTNTNSDTTTLTFASKLDNTLPSGTYGTTLVFIATANVATPNCSATNVCYSPNGADGTTTMANEVITYNSENSTYSQSMLYASNFSNTDNGFIGWNTKPDGSGIYYGPHQTLTTTELEGVVSSGLQLYAQWMPVERDSSGNAVTMQDWMADNGCARLSDGAITALKDGRDGNVYAVVKAPMWNFTTNSASDSACWMMENLRLANTSGLDSTNTNNPFNGNGSVTSPADLATFTGLSATSNSWCITNNSACDDQSMLNTTATANTVGNMTGNNQNVYSYGNYYNWFSATAGWGRYNTTYTTTDDKTINTSTNAQSMPGDICPTNWHLPTGGAFASNGGQTPNKENSDFFKLAKAIATSNQDPGAINQYSHYYYSSDPATNTAPYMTSIIRSYPYNFLFSGNWGGGQVYGRGSYGYFWSSTALDANYAFSLYLNTSNVGPGTDYYYKHNGFPVRCTTGS